MVPVALGGEGWLGPHLTEEKAKAGRGAGQQAPPLSQLFPSSRQRDPEKWSWGASRVVLSQTS